MKDTDRAPKILVVDDDNSFRAVLTHELAFSYPLIHAAESGKQALELCEAMDFDVVLMDIRMPDRDGLSILRELKSRNFDGEIIMLTGHATVDTAIRALKCGAYDYLIKPCKLEELESIIQKAFEKRVLRSQNRRLRQILDRQSGAYAMVGNSPALQGIRELVRKVAAADSTVLLLGETGVGKGVVARAIHGSSDRKAHPFVVVDCTALQEQLLQSELFGHEKGAFTGATSSKPGLFEIAEGGTIFMDEIGDLTPGLQVQLLQVLDSGTYRRLGGVRDLRLDVRILAATNRDLETMVREERFREDLYFRINVVTIMVPPLRERKEDVPLLVQHFISKANSISRKPFHISESALEMLQRYSWPGNIRELKNVMQRALILAEGMEILPIDLPGNLNVENGVPPLHMKDSLPSLRELELSYIRNLLRRFSGHRTSVAKALGISERSLYRKLHDYDLE